MNFGFNEISDQSNGTNFRYTEENFYEYGEHNELSSHLPTAHMTKIMR